MTTIHSSAIVHPQARLAADVEVGPYTIIGEHVEIGSDGALQATEMRDVDSLLPQEMEGPLQGHADTSWGRFPGGGVVYS